MATVLIVAEQQPDGKLRKATLHAIGAGKALADKAVTVRCIQRADGTVPADEDEPDLVAICGRSY